MVKRFPLGLVAILPRLAQLLLLGLAVNEARASTMSEPAMLVQHASAALRDHWLPIVTRLGKNEVFTNLLENKFRLDSAARRQILALGREYLDYRRLTTAMEFHAWVDPNDWTVRQFELPLSTDRSIRWHRSEQPSTAWQIDEIKHQLDQTVTAYHGRVQSTLWESATESGLSSEAVMQLATIFAWQIDFDREVRAGNRWSILIEKFYVDGEFSHWGNVQAAMYHLGDDTHTAVRYASGEEVDYFDVEGYSLRGLFLKSPLTFGRITSTFKRRRFHPILKTHRPHLGVDYGAPRGTPVKSVGSGRIVKVGRSSTAGNYLVVRHNSVYRTAYKHLHGWARGIRKGTKVKQGQVIGYVGSTGLATGPHLHFEFYKHGRVVDPLGITFPREKRLAADDHSEFQDHARKVLKDLVMPNTKLAANIRDFLEVQL